MSRTQSTSSRPNEGSSMDYYERESIVEKLNALSREHYNAVVAAARKSTKIPPHTLDSDAAVQAIRDKDPASMQVMNSNPADYPQEENYGEQHQIDEGSYHHQQDNQQFDKVSNPNEGGEEEEQLLDLNDPLITNGVGTVKSNSKLSNADRKAQHKEVERKRREAINDGISKLSELVPNCDSKATHKGTIILNAVNYITELKVNEASNIEKWTLEKLLMDQAMNDLSQQLKEAERTIETLREEREVLMGAGVKVEMGNDHNEESRKRQRN